MLPKGITGFGDITDLPAPPQDERRFRQFCHAFARAHQGRVNAFDLDLSGKSFYAAEIELGHRRFSLLGNAFYPWIAFAEPMEYAEITFVDAPFVLTAPDVRLLTPDELRQDWRGCASRLGETEMKQIRYWKPQTVGEIVFNFWD